jgi:hypothetical protein
MRRDVWGGELRSRRGHACRRAVALGRGARAHHRRRRGAAAAGGGRAGPGDGLRPLHRGAQARQRGHGRGVPRLRSAARPRGGAQGAAPRRAHGRSRARACSAPARGPGHGPPVASQRGARVRRGDGGGARVPGDGARGWPYADPVAAAGAARVAAGARRDGGRRAGPGGGPRRGPRAPRLQARQRDDRCAGARTGDGLRARAQRRGRRTGDPPRGHLGRCIELVVLGEGRRPRRGGVGLGAVAGAGLELGDAGAHAHRLRAGHAGLHGARAALWGAARSRERPVQLLRGAVRVPPR